LSTEEYEEYWVEYLAAPTTSPTDGSAQMAAFSGQQAVLDGDQRRFEEIARVGRREVA
jgi:hypothetical protein